MNDKIKHLIAGLFAAAVIGMPAYYMSGKLFCGLWPAIIGGLAVAAVKEACDANNECNRWDWRDFGASAVGVLIAAAIIILWHIWRM